MAKKIVDEFIVPKCNGKAFIVKKGQAFRVIQIGGGQVADIRFFNPDNYKEQFGAVHSMMLNTIEGIERPYVQTKKLYSKVPWERLMLTVIEDTVGVNTMGSHCSRKGYELRGNPEHRSCGDNFRDCLEPYGITLEDMDSAGVFNAFMPRNIAEDGSIRYSESPAKDGDYIDFRAEMDVLVAFSNCPSEPPVNPPGYRDMKVQILE